METHAAILTTFHQPLLLRTVTMPSLQKGQVLVRILASGVCRTQVNELHGVKGPDPYLPHLLGHEGYGEVVTVGRGVTKVRPKQKVIASWIKGKGLEGGAKTYQLGKTTIHAGSITTWSTYSIISENKLTPVPHWVPADIGSILGCAVLTGVGIIRHTLKVQKGTSIAVFGVGGIGGSAILGAKLAGCTRILAIDVTNEKLRFAKTLGATEGKLAHDIGKESVDYVVEASGNRIAMETAFQVLAPRGILAIAGNLKKGETVAIDPFDLICGKHILGTWGGESDPDADIPFLLTEWRNGRLPIEKLITKRFPFEKVQDALHMLETNQALGRVILEMP